MSSSAPWSVKGIDAKARETAKELARRSGMTLGEWLNERIREEGGSMVEESADAVSRALHDLTGRIEQAEQRSTLAVTGIDQSVRGVAARLDLAEREQTAVGARFEGALQETQSLQAGIDARLRKLESEAAGPRSAEALKSLEASLGRVANHLYDGENRTRESLAELARDMKSLSARLEKAETAQGKFGAEADVAALVARLDQAESKAASMVRVLENSYAELAQRVAVAERRLDARPDPTVDVDKKLEEMASHLARGLQAARAEMTKQLKEAIDGGETRMDEALLSMSAHVQAAERRSAEALERMGQEVLRVADVLNRRVQGVENRSAGSLQSITGEVSRAVEGLETRVARTEAVQADSVEKLGGEIARVTERLSERIGTAERRAAQAVDDVQDKLALAAERLNQRHDRAQGDLAERIRISEERTQRLLEEARDRIDRRMAETAKAQAPATRAISPMAAPPIPATPSPYAEPVSFAADPLEAPDFPQAQPESAGAIGRAIYPDAAPFGQTFAPRDFRPVEPEFDQADIEVSQDFAAPLAPESEADFVEDDFRQSDLDDEPLIAATAFEDEDEVPLAAEAPILEEEPEPIAAQAQEITEAEDLLEPVRLDAPPPPPAAASIAPRILTTKELVEQARAAARAASDESKARKTRPSRPPVSEGQELGGIGFATRQRKDNTKVALFATFTGVAAILGGAGYTLLFTPVGEDIAKAWSAKPGSEIAGEDEGPRAAVALNPKPIAPTAPAVTVPGAPDPAAVSLYAEGVRKLEAKDKAGLEAVQRSANLGYSKAQNYLAGLYEDGLGGLTKNPIEARRWYERAAKAGNVEAMHNTALLHYDGIGGPKNRTSAFEWFKRAAELGYVNSQFNLAQLYEAGEGQPQNAAEAYKWYIIASKGGSPSQQAEARNAADKIKAVLPADARAVAERLAIDFMARGSDQSVQVTAPGIELAGVQRALSRLGYFRGEPDGRGSTELRTAIQDFQRDNGLAQNGQIDGMTAARMRPYIQDR